MTEQNDNWSPDELIDDNDGKPTRTENRSVIFEIEEIDTPAPTIENPFAPEIESAPKTENVPLTENMLNNKPKPKAVILRRSGDFAPARTSDGAKSASGSNAFAPAGKIGQVAPSVKAAPAGKAASAVKAAPAGQAATSGKAASAAKAAPTAKAAPAKASAGSAAKATVASKTATRTVRRRKIRRSNPISVFGRMFFMLFLILIVVGFVGVGIVGGYAFNAIDALGDYDLRILSGDLTTFVYDRNDNQIAIFHSEKDRIPLDPMDIPTRMKQAIVAIEDMRFFQHKGIDPIRIVGAFKANLESGGISQGASTITMQVVRLTILDVSNLDKSYERKIQEAWLSYQLEQLYSKEQILAFYLNNVYYGQRAYSCATAAKNYFGKDIKNLTLGEYAFLAGVVNGPVYYDPFKNMARAKSRQALVLNEMVKMGYITQDEADAAAAAPLNVVKGATQIDDQDYANQSFLDFTFNQACEILGINKDNAIRMFTGGYRIYTTLDVVTQAKAEEIYKDDENFPVVKEEGKLIQSAMTIMNIHNGEILMMVGGRKINEVRGFNRAADAYRQPGSAFKPIVAYGPALELGWNPGNVLDDYSGGFTVEKDFSNSDNSYRGLVTLRAAIQSSLNTIAVKLIERIGTENGIKFAKKLGITSLVESGRYNDYGPSLALGGVTKGICPLELTAAFAAFGNNGIYNKPFAIRRIEDYKGNVIYEHTLESKVAMSPQTAYLMTDMLVSAVSGGTGSRARLANRPTAGKTGTTSQNVDAWFAGFTPDLAGTLWMGYDISEKMPGVFGGTYCAPLWKEIMEVAHRDMPVTSFPVADGIRSVTIDAKSGLLPSELTPPEFIITEKFNAAFVPTEESNVWIQAPVCADSGLLLTDECPYVAMKTFLRRQEPWTGTKAPQDASLEVPTQFCGTHGSGAFIVTDPDDPTTQLRLYQNTETDPETGVTRVNLAWYASKADINTVFHIYRSQSPNTPANAASRLGVLNYTSASYTDTFEPLASGEYYYYMQAIDKTNGEILGVSPEIKTSFGDQAYYDTGYGEYPENQRLTLQGAMIPYGGGSGYAIQLIWNEIFPGNDVIYQIYRSEDPNFIPDAGALLMEASNLRTNSFTDTNLISGRTYYYRVAGIDLTRNAPIPVSTRLYATIP